MQLTVDSREFAMWRAYYEVEPWGEERADLRAGIIAHTTYTMRKGKGGKTLSPADFMPQFGTRAYDPAEAASKLFAIAQAAHKAHTGKRKK